MKKCALLCLLLLCAAAALPADSRAARQAAKRGQKAERAGDFQAAHKAYALAAQEDPRNVEYIIRREMTKQKAVFRMVSEGQRRMQQGDYAEAARIFAAANDLDPTNDFAKTQRKEAEAKLPRPAGVPENLPDETALVALRPKDILRSWDFRGDTRGLYAALGAAYGIEFLIDDEVPAALRSRLILEDVDFSKAVSAAGAVTKTFVAPIDERSAIVAPESSVKRLQFERQVLKNLDVSALTTPEAINEIAGLLRTLFEMRWVSVNAVRKVISVRDTAGHVAQAEAVVRSLVQGRPEVMIEIQSIAVNLNLARTLGILPDLQYQFGRLTPTSLLSRIATGSFGVTLPSASLAATLSRSVGRELSTIQIRSVDGQPATFLLGERYPIVTATFSAPILTGTALQQQQNGTLVNPFPSFTFEDIGIKIKATPRIQTQSEVSLAIEMQTRSIESITATGQPTLSNREFTSQLTLVDGQSAILSGILTRQEQKSLNGLFGLAGIPGLGLLFGQQTKQDVDLEVLVLITPHILRLGPAQTEASATIAVPSDYVPVWR